MTYHVTMHVTYHRPMSDCPSSVGTVGLSDCRTGLERRPASELTLSPPAHDDGSSVPQGSTTVGTLSESVGGQVSESFGAVGVCRRTIVGALSDCRNRAQ